MKLKSTLGSLAVAASLALSAGGCMVEARGHVAGPAVVEVDEEPPPPQETVVEVRPGQVWIEGRWNRVNNRWVWGAGRWERERVGYRWEQGRWENRGRRHVWVEGGWRGAERREERREERRDVRDHRH